jgi:hypothetical protein
MRTEKNPGVYVVSQCDDREESKKKSESVPNWNYNDASETKNEVPNMPAEICARPDKVGVALV